MDTVNGWGTALGTLRRLADITGQQLGDEVGLTRAAISLYEHQQRGPDSGIVRRLNSALARLMDLPEASEYLNALAVVDGLLPPQGGDDAEVGFLAQLVEEFDPYFQGGTLRVIAEAMRPLNRSVRMNIARRCAVARGRELVRRLAGKPPKSAGLAEFLAFFRDAGAPLDGALRWDEAVVRRFLHDHFEERVCETFASMDPDSAMAHLVAARVIVNFFDQTLDDALDRKRTEEIVRHRLVPHSSAASLPSTRSSRPRGRKGTK